MSFVVGLTGGIGSGKSTVAELFAGHGAAIVDADAVAHALTAPGGLGLAPLRAAFGNSILRADGALDRVTMRALAFSDPQAKEQLEAILHPLIRAACEAAIGEAVDAPYVMLVVPLLVESGAYAKRIDRLLVVDCPEEKQIARVMARSGLPADEVRRIMSTQATRASRLAAASDVLDNAGDPAALQAPVARLHARYCAMAREKNGQKVQVSR